MWGLKYESIVGNAIEKTLGPIAKVRKGQWFEFEDRNGLGVCQPDIIIELPNKIIVCECKLTETSNGRDQIKFLYGPILEKYYNLPVHGIVVSRHLTMETNKSLICASMEMALSKSYFVIPTLHYLGKGRL